uniref:Uncharacterized protein n=1 Tax=Solanum lycopersicum TaxID=4081 RepID=A0A3Q7EE94_SOLLC
MAEKIVRVINLLIGHGTNNQAEVVALLFDRSCVSDEVSFEPLDKGAIEILSPYGISYTFRRLAEQISQLQSGFVVRRVRYVPNSDKDADNSHNNESPTTDVNISKETETESLATQTLPQ